MKTLRDADPELSKGWMIVRRARKSDFIKKVTLHDISVEKLKEKMEVCIQQNVYRSLVKEKLESSGKEYEGGEDHKETTKGDVSDVQDPLDNDNVRYKQIEEQKRKLIQNYQWTSVNGNPPKRRQVKKLQTVSDKLEKDKDQLKILLIEADEETIKENIPEASLAKCLDAFSTARNICLRINQAISAKEGQNVEEHFSAAKKSITRIAEMIKLLVSTVQALRTA